MDRSGQKWTRVDGEGISVDCILLTRYNVWLTRPKAVKTGLCTCLNFFLERTTTLHTVHPGKSPPTTRRHWAGPGPIGPRR